MHNEPILCVPPPPSSGLKAFTFPIPDNMLYLWKYFTCGVCVHYLILLYMKILLSENITCKQETGKKHCCLFPLYFILAESIE